VPQVRGFRGLVLVRGVEIPILGHLGKHTPALGQALYSLFPTPYYPASQKMGGKGLAFAAARPWVVLKLLQWCVYCKSLVTSCCTLLACANAAMPVWLKISYFDMLDVAAA